MKFSLPVINNELRRIEQNIKQQRHMRKRLFQYSSLIEELNPDSISSGSYDLVATLFIDVPGFTTIACPWLADAIECLTNRLGVEPTSYSGANDVAAAMLYIWKYSNDFNVTLYATLNENALCHRIPIGAPEEVEELRFVKTTKQRYVFKC